MKELFRSVAMALSMFSAVPVPQVEWKKENMRYMLASLPLVGVLIALILWGWLALASLLRLGNALFAAGMTLLPLMLSGGIHMDGFADTVDALSSHAEPEKKRAILKDPHAGAFAILFSCGYLLLYFSLCTELPRTRDAVFAVGLTHILARAVGALAGACFPSSGETGLLRTFHDAADRSAAGILLAWTLLSGAALVWLSPICGGAAVTAALLCLLYTRRMSIKQFGGMSGDLAGFLISLAEIGTLFVYVIVQKAVTVCS